MVPAIVAQELRPGMERHAVLELLGPTSMEHWIPHLRKSRRKLTWEWGVNDSLEKALNRFIDSYDDLPGTLTYNYGLGASGPYLLVLCFRDGDHLAAVTALEAM